MNSKQISLSEAVSFTIEASKRRNLRHRYVLSMAHSLKQFIEGRADRPISSVTAEEIDDWLAKWKPVTRRGVAGRLGSMFAYAMRKRFISENPMMFTERVTVEMGTPDILTPQQAESLLEFTRTEFPRSLAFLTLCLFCGLRPAEAQRLRWENIREDDALIRIDPAGSKLRRQRFVAIVPAAAAWLAVSSRTDSLPATQYSLDLWHPAAAKHLGLPTWSTNVLRHSAASYLLAATSDEGRVATQLGTSSAMLRRHYLSLVGPRDAMAFWAIRPRDTKQLELL